jgi:hypothetical protein
LVPDAEYLKMISMVDAAVIAFRMIQGFVIVLGTLTVMLAVIVPDDVNTMILLSHSASVNVTVVVPGDRDLVKIPFVKVFNSEMLLSISVLVNGLPFVFLNVISVSAIYYTR